MFNMRTGFIGRNVMQEDMYYWKICITGRRVSGDHVLHENMCQRRKFLVCGHVIQVCAKDATI